MLESNCLGLMSNFDSLMEFDLFESDVMTLDNEINGLQRMSFSSCSASPVHSSSTASSESGDLTSFEYCNALNDYVLNEDPILSGVVADDDNYTDLLFNNNSVSKQSFSENISEFSNFANLTGRSDSLSNSRSRSTSKESLETLEALTKIITCKMGLREQLEVFRIVNPTAVTTLTDEEITLGLKNLDKKKLQRIKDYVQSQTLIRSSTESNSSKNKYKASSSKSHVNRVCNSNSFMGKTKTSKSKKRHQRKVEKTFLKRNPVQRQKESESGLFMQQEILKLSRLSQNDDDDVDILE